MRPTTGRAVRPGLLPALVVLGCAGLAASLLQEGPLIRFLPSGNEVPGWARDGEPQEYEGEDLYTYIDGGAEIYQEYGFRRVIVQDYENSAGMSVSLEIFEMATPAAAFGMFTFKRSGQGKSLDLGGGAELESYYLNFWEGRFLVTLTGFDDSRGTIEGLVALAGIVGQRLPEGGRSPGLVGALPTEGLVAGSVKYFKGLLGLNNVYPFYTARGLAFAEGTRGLYGDGTALILLDYGSAEAGGSARSELHAYLAGSERFERTEAAGTETPVFRDGKGRFVAFGGSGTRLAIGVAAKADAALEIIVRTR